MAPHSGQPHVVIVGGGFGGLYAAKTLGNRPVRVTLVDRRNFHLFQPLLYQIVIGELSPGDVATPLRSTFRHYPNITILMNEMTGIDPEKREILLREQPETLAYDYLILATGGSTHYFGHEDTWAKHANGLKTLEEALDMRRQIFTVFEAAERETDPEKQAMLLTFVIIGGGPTGVELAGALAELTRLGLKHDFRRIKPEQARILIVESAPRLLATYPEDLSEKAAKALQNRGVSVRTGTMVTDIQENGVTLSKDGQTEQIAAGTVLWAAGVKASPIGKTVAEAAGCETDKGGRVVVNGDCTVPGHPEIYVIGDLSSFTHTPDGKPLPGVAPVAIQQGEYVARHLLDRLVGKARPPFRYRNKGNLAVIGLNEAVADLGRMRFGGFLAWLIWALVHITYLIEFDNKLMVMFQWFWTYLTRRTSARLITGRQSYD